MTTHSSDEQLRTLLAGMAKVGMDGVGLDDDLTQVLGLDSLAGLRLLAAVEKRFAVRFPDDRLAEFRTLRRILEVIEAQHQGPRP